MAIRLDLVLCPGCARSLKIGAIFCPSCRWEMLDGPIPSLGNFASGLIGRDVGALNDVSPLFIAELCRASRINQGSQ